MNCHSQNISTSFDRFARSADDGNVVSIGPFYFAKNENNEFSDQIGDYVEEVKRTNSPTYINGGTRLGKTDVLIAVLLGPDYTIHFYENKLF